MAETYTAGALLALEAQPYRPEAFVKIAFPGYTFRASTMLRDYTLDSEAYVAAGPLGSISAMAENADITADPITLTLTGLDTSLAAELRDITHQGAPVTIKVAFFDDNDVLIPDSVTVFVGVVDTMSFQLGATLTITCVCDSYMRLLFRGPDGRRRMQADQEELFTGDKALEFTARLIDDIPWGVPTKVGNVSARGGGTLQSRIGAYRT